MTSSEYQHFAFSATSVELNLKVLEMHKWNIQTDRVQRVDKKNCIICPFIMFPSKVMVIKFQKCLIFCIFYWYQQKISHSLEKIFRCISKIFFSSFRKCYGFLDSELRLPFSKRTQKDLSGARKCFPLTVTNFLLSSLKNTTNEALFDILMTITLGVNMITTKMTPF